MAATVARRTSLAGAEVQLLVLAGGQRWCAAIDLSCGALVTARWDDPVPAFSPFAVVQGRVAFVDPDEEPDPVRPEQLPLVAAPAQVRRAARRRAERWVRPVLHPPTEHLLGFAGPATPYWTLTGARPSVAVVDPPAPPEVADGYCRFRWRNVTQALPLLPQALAWRQGRPRRVVVTLSAPRRGQCYKVVAALL